MTLDHLVHDGSNERQLKQRAEQALKEGKITQQEYDFYLQKELGIAPLASDNVVHHDYARRKPHSEHRKQAVSKIVATVLVLIILGNLLWILTYLNGTTGLVTLTPTQQVVTPGTTATESTILALNATNTTMIKITGNLTNGSATVYAVIGEQRLLVYDGSALLEQYRVETDKASYALNEQVLITVTAENYTLWLTTPEDEKVPITGYTTERAGTFKLDALITEGEKVVKTSTTFIVRDDTDPANDVPFDPMPRTPFVDACDETCDIPDTGATPINLEIAVTDGGILTIDTITTSAPRENQAPVQAATVPDVTVAVGESATLDLNTYFTDPDGDTLTYDFMDVPGIDLSVTDSILTVTGVSEGSQESLLYASDLYALIQSNAFTITVTAENIDNTTNETTQLNLTVNETENGTGELNITTNLTENVTPDVTPELNVTITTDCSDPDPNNRPLECLDNQQYFQDQTILIADNDNVPVARITPIGNLLLTGEVLEQASFDAAQNDYRLGYEDAYGNRITTIWFSSDGNLYLRGQLFEENANLEPQPGAYVLRNRKGIILAWADTATGDLYVRGNVIPFRKDIMK